MGDEEHAPYDRPPLSKGLLAGHDRGLRGRAAPAGLARRARRRAASSASGRRGSTPAGERCCSPGDAGCATTRWSSPPGGCRGCSPACRARQRPRPRTLDDALALRAALAPSVRLAVVGAGLVGLEVAATARALGAAVTVVEAAPAPLAAVLGERIGCWLAEMQRAAGVEVLTGVAVEAVQGGARVSALRLGDGRRVACDTVLVAVGMAPATGWLDGCGLPAGAVAADPEGRTLVPHVYAAGDVRGAGHWEMAARQGATVAATILGVPAPAAPPAAFWSDQHGVRLQFAGTAAGHDRVEVEGDPLAGDACALFHRGGRLVGGLLVGRPRDLPALRRRLEQTTLEYERSAA